MDATKLMSLMQDKKASLARRDKASQPKPGDNRIVLLPGWRKGEEHVWFHEFGQHFIKNTAGEIKAVYPCADATYGKPCSICDGLAQAQRSTKDDDLINALGEAKAGRVVMINALDLGSDQPNTPVPYAIKRGVFGDLVTLVEQWGVQVFQKELLISRVGKGLNTKYSIQITPKDVMVPPAVLEKLIDLDEYVKQESAEQQARALGAISALVGLPSPGGTSAPVSDKPLTSASALMLDSDQDAGLLEMELAGALNPVVTGTSTVSLEAELDSLLGGAN